MFQEKLIKEVKKHTILYTKGNKDYTNKVKRAEAWKSISEALNTPETACQSRWRSLRDRFVKEYNKAPSTSNSPADSRWIYFEDLLFLQEQVTTRKSTTSIPQAPSLVNESYAEPKFEVISEDSSVNHDDSSSEAPSTSHRSRKRNANASVNRDDLSDFLGKMSNIAEKRFCSQTEQVLKNDEKHTGFFLMVQDYFKKIPDNVIDDCKIFYLNYLHNLIRDSNENLLS